MREILFRGKRDDNGEWVYGAFIPDLREVYFGDEIDGFIKPFGITKEERLMVDVDRKTVGQFTGLTDKSGKNGKKIFEGDIIRYCKRLDYQMYQDSIEDPEAYDGELYIPAFSIGTVVYYTDGFSGFDINNHKFDCNGLSELMCSGDYFYEVIGNIYDNPELLEETKHEY